MNYQNGGWYNNPQTGKNQQYWNGQWYDSPQQGTNNDPTTQYNNALNTLNNNTNNYFNQQQGFYQKQHDISDALYNAQNQNLLGTQSAGDSQKFLNGIEDPLQKQQGLYQYQYGLDTGHENNTYGLQTTANTQNRQNALDKLANDQNYALAGLGLNQGNQNAQTIDSLNSRGLVYGQKPTGAYNPTAMGGMTGVAGQTAGLVNQDFANQRGQLTSDYGLNVANTNNQYNQQQNLLNENHSYDLKNDAMNTVNNINNQNAQYSYNTGMADNALEQYKAQMENLKQQQLAKNPQTVYTQSLLKNNAYTGQ